jgi:hypothetical protein
LPGTSFGRNSWSRLWAVRRGRWSIGRLSIWWGLVWPSESEVFCYSCSSSLCALTGKGDRLWECGRYQPSSEGVLLIQGAGGIDGQVLCGHPVGTPGSHSDQARLGSQGQFLSLLHSYATSGLVWLSAEANAEINVYVDLEHEFFYLCNLTVRHGPRHRIRQAQRRRRVCGSVRRVLAVDL